MTEHGHGHGDGHGHGPDDEGLATLLDLDAEVLGTYLDDVTGWVAQQTPDPPRAVVDLGAGTGTGSLALARRFPGAQVVAVDRSTSMLDRVRAAADEHGLGDRVRGVQADLDVALPPLGPVHLAWMASSLHEVADPARVLRGVLAALDPGGVLVVVEMDSPPRLLPDDVGVGRPGLEVRCHEAVAQRGWNAHPDWHANLEEAGFEVPARRTFTIDADPVPPGTGRYARAYLGTIRSAMDGGLAPDDLEALDHLLADDHPGSLVRRGDLTLRVSRTVWLARRPVV